RSVNRLENCGFLSRKAATRSHMIRFMKTTTLPLNHWINRALYRLALVIPLVVGCFAFLPQARADCEQGCDIDHNDTFLGNGALVNRTTGADNTAAGAFALTVNTVGFGSTAVGNAALAANTTASFNTATGNFALADNTGGNNTATGAFALRNNTTGNENT